MYNRAELEAFIRGILREKEYKSFDDVDKDDIAEDLMQRLVAQIEITLVDELDDAKAEELNQMIQKNNNISDEKLGAFFKGCGINTEEVVAKVKNNFRDAFLLKNKNTETEEKGE